MLKTENRVVRGRCMRLTPLFLLTTTVAAQTPAPTQPTGAVATGAVFFSIGGGYDAYKTPSVESLFSLGVQIGSTPFYSISTLSFQSGLVTARSGFGYAAKQFGWGKSKPFFLVLLADAGATTGSTTSTTVTPTTTSTTTSTVTTAISTPTVANFSLGNVGGGAVIRYDMGSLTGKLKGIGVACGYRVAAIAGTSIHSEWVGSINYFLK